MQIALQNQSDHAKGFTAVGAQPLYMGPASTIELTVDQYLTYEPQFTRCTEIERNVDGNARILIDGKVCAARDLSAAIRAGHFGEDAAKRATKLDKERAAELAVVEAGNSLTEKPVGKV